MLRHHSNRTSGFTLIELAIVLGITGILFGGLWRLLSTTNVQTRDQATAAQHAQIVSAVGAYLQSTGPVGSGVELLRIIAGNTPTVLTLPGAASPAGSGTCPTTAPMSTAVPSNALLCNFLPPGFTNATTNPYGQTYRIIVLKDGTAAGTSPATYTFMVATTGGDVIADTSGGRISGMIGGDGGFMYAVDPCANQICGSFGGWGANVLTYAIADSTGHIASRTFYSATQNTDNTWLARRAVTGDATFSLNKMTTPFYLGRVGGVANTGIMYMGDSNVATATDGGTMFLQGGTIALGTAGTISGTAGAAAGSGGGSIELSGKMNNALKGLLILTSDCSINNAATPNCREIFQVNGDGNVNGRFQAVGFYSPSFIYDSDERLKKEITPLSGALNEILKIKPVSFVFKANGQKSLGVIAQDLEKIYPELVETGRDGYKGVSYGGLVAPLVAAVQELKKENDGLRMQLHDQKLRQEKMEEKLRALRKY